MVPHLNVWSSPNCDSKLVPNKTIVDVGIASVLLMQPMHVEYFEDRRRATAGDR